MHHSAASVAGSLAGVTPSSSNEVWPRFESLVFLVDDDSRMRQAIRELLEDAGLRIVGEAVNGLDAVRQIPVVAQTGRVVVLMDVRMPGPVNGIEATRLIRDRTGNARVLIWTAFEGPGIEAAALEAGAVGVLTKGLPGEVLMAAIRAASVLETVPHA